MLDLRNLQEQVKKAFCYQKFFWPFTVWINCSSDLKIFANSWSSASNIKTFSRSLEQFFLTVGRNNFGNNIPKLSKENRITITKDINSQKIYLLMYQKKFKLRIDILFFKVKKFKEIQILGSQSLPLFSTFLSSSNKIQSQTLHWVLMIFTS